MPRRSVVCALLAAWLVSLVAATWGEQLASLAPREAPAFRHSTHVVEDWGNWARRNRTETFRDCRGCHRFGEGARSSMPQRECKQCHYGDGKLEIFGPEYGQDQASPPLADAVLEAADLSGLARFAREGFRHHTHGMLQCAECHAGDPDAMSVPDDIPIRSGPGECARCHERGRAETVVGELKWFEAVARDEALARACGLEGKFELPTDPAAYAAYADYLVEVFASSPDGKKGLNNLLSADGNDFTHGDHFGLSCRECHSGIPTADAVDVGTGAIEVKSCATCHLGPGGGPNPARPPAKSPPRPLWSLGSFAHGDHYQQERTKGVCLESAYTRLQGDRDQSCQHCHDYAPEAAGPGSRDFPFDGDKSKHRYRNCQECHAVDAWRTGELEADRAPLHSSNSGEESGWLAQRCDECHVFSGVDMKTERPEESVQRWAGVTFAFEGQTHPYITGGLDKDCKDCHRAGVEELPSRLIKKRFRHATHLPPGEGGLDNARCVSCHKSAATATSSAGLADAALRTYDAGVCADCHKAKDNAPVVEDVDPRDAPASRAAVSFPHKQHVEHLACSACHTLGDQGEDFVTLPAAKRCNECHDHVSGEGPIAGLLDQGPGAAAAVQGRLRALHHIFDDDIASCANCHHDPSAPGIAAVPAIRGTAAAATDPRYTVEPDEFAGFQVAQHHPLEQKCSQCHKANLSVTDGVIAPIPVAADPHVYAERRTFHARQGETSTAAFVNGKGCMSCHWHAASLGQFDAEPAGDRTREALGNDFEGWPGVTAEGRVEQGR